MVVNDSSKKGVCNDLVAPVCQVYPSASATSKVPVTTELDDDTNTDKVTYASHGPKCPPSSTTFQIKVSLPHPDMATVSAQLCSLVDMVVSLCLWDS
jgi:hypothetical protein